MDRVAKTTRTGSALSTRFETETTYDRSAYEALADVSWKMFREHFVQTRAYPFMFGICVLIALSLIVFWRRYSTPVIVVHVVFFLFFLISMPLSNVTGKRRLCNKAIRNVSAQGEFPFKVRFCFTENMIRAYLPRDQYADTTYAQITDIISYGKWMFLFCGDRSYILNRDSFENAEVFEQFEGFISQKTGQTIWEMQVPRSRRAAAGAA